MKQKIAPTSPKNRKDEHAIEEVYKATLQQDFDRPAKKTFGVGNIIFFLFTSIVAGIVGTMFFLSQSDRLGFTTLSNIANNVLIRNNSESYTTQINFADHLVQATTPAMIRLYDQVLPDEPAAVQDALLTQEHFVGIGFLLTSNGIGFTSHEVLEEGKTYTALTANARTYELSVTYADDVSKLAFFQLSGEDFPVVDIAEQGSSFPSEEVYVLHREETQKQFALTEVAMTQKVRDQFLYPDLFISSSEDFFSDVMLQDRIGYPKGTPIVRGDGTLLGFFNGNAEQPAIVYLPERRQILDQYVLHKTIAYPQLGLHGIDLSVAPYLPEQFTQGAESGFMLASSSDGAVQAVTEETAASIAGLRAGDVITEVNGLSLSSRQTLAQALLQAQDQEAFSISFLREGNRQSVSIPNAQNAE